MNCTTHQGHQHQHHNHCGHQRIKHNDHVDYLHDGHLHAPHDGHFDEHVIEVSDQNPAECNQVECKCDHNYCGHELVPHGDHLDRLVDGRLHHKHGDHCDDHGPVELV